MNEVKFTRKVSDRFFFGAMAWGVAAIMMSLGLQLDVFWPALCVVMGAVMVGLGSYFKRASVCRLNDRQLECGIGKDSFVAKLDAVRRCTVDESASKLQVELTDGSVKDFDCSQAQGGTRAVLDLLRQGLDHSIIEVKQSSGV